MDEKVYLATLFSRREELEEYAKRFKQEGFDVTSSWVFGGEEGLSRQEICLLDLNDVDKSDTIVSFTYERGTLTPGGGRHVEFGYALARGKRLVLIGPKENVFHEFPTVEIYQDLDHFFLEENIKKAMK